MFLVRRFSLPALLAAVLCSMVLPRPSGAQDHQAAALGNETSPACSDQAFRAFDYWLGSWDVFNAQGDTIGHNLIRRVSAGCAIREEWTPTRQGFPGTSVNFWDPQDTSWHQVWVGGGGQILRLRGAPREDGTMVLAGESKTPRGVVLNRLSWIPDQLPQPTEVEQRWELSTDGGSNWQVVFQGFYRRASAPAPEAPQVESGLQGSSSEEAPLPVLSLQEVDGRRRWEPRHGAHVAEGEVVPELMGEKRAEFGGGKVPDTDPVEARRRCSCASPSP